MNVAAAPTKGDLRRFHYVSQLMAMDIRVSITGLVYKKVLSISRESLTEVGIGQIINMLHLDLFTLDRLLPSLPYVLIGPLLIAIEVAIIWYMFGPAMLAGFVFFPIFALIQGILLRWFPILRVKFNQFTDNRLKLVNDLISGMKVVKMYAAELVLARSIQDARRKEERNIYQRSALKALNNILFYVSVKVIIFLTVMVCYVKFGELDANRVFVIMTLIYNLRIPLMFHLPISLSLLPEVLISIYRIQERVQDFLLMPDKDGAQESATDQNVERSSSRLVVDKIWSSWSSKNSETAAIKNISFSLRPGELLAVIGPVGSGKLTSRRTSTPGVVQTSLLLALLGEHTRLHGRTILRGTVAYASQEPWLFAGTLRDNILFGSDFDSERYKRVLRAAALDRDLVTLQHGDQDPCGEPGRQSERRPEGEGQPGQVLERERDFTQGRYKYCTSFLLDICHVDACSRALYLDADIYLLDDPLSAVDARVAKNIFQR
ncbi:ABCC4 [Cordylochernes scorpioides]|uniref:ABCC4 n=1 Tax=Cordylochernes scorpioides TaxID=51811 RepID=A0ABY6KLQ1_9ARAC|nr:ABCC4 [Cordylochernes scorpioides]